MINKLLSFCRKILILVKYVNTEEPGNTHCEEKDHKEIKTNELTWNLTCSTAH
jgi:hypothetical protein